MKAKLLIMGVLCAIAFNVNAQTKGMNTLGFGLSASTNKSKSQLSEHENKSKSISLDYGLFIKDNERVGFGVNYGKSESSSPDEYNNYGANISFQKYYPLVKKLFAYAGANVAFNQSKQITNTNTYNQKAETYSLGARGGLTWFVSKRFAFETSLLAADLYYAINKYSNYNNTSYQENSTTQFNLSTQGFIDDLGFKIYLLF